MASVVIDSAELDYLRDELRFLECLRDTGVDNWEGYDIAVEMYQEGQE